MLGACNVLRAALLLLLWPPAILSVAGVTCPLLPGLALRRWRETPPSVCSCSHWCVRIVHFTADTSVYRAAFSPPEMQRLLCSLLLQQTKPENSLTALNPSSKHSKAFSPGGNPVCQGCAQLLCSASASRNKEQLTASSLLLPMQVSEVVQVQILLDSNISNRLYLT